MHMWTVWLTIARRSFAPPDTDMYPTQVPGEAPQSTFLMTSKNPTDVSSAYGVTWKLERFDGRGDAHVDRMDHHC